MCKLLSLHVTKTRVQKTNRIEKRTSVPIMILIFLNHGANDAY